MGCSLHLRAIARAAMSIALALSLFALAPGVHAQEEEASAYRRTIDAALEEFDAGRWAEARALFVRAQSLNPNARTLRGIGMASFELRDYPAALDALVAALAETRRALTEEQRTQVTDLIERARAFVGRYRIAAMPEGTELFVDGAPRTPAGGWPATEGELVLGVGDHTVEARPPAAPASTARLLVRGGEEDTLGLSAPLSALEPAAVPAAVPAAGHAAATERGPSVGPWIVVGTGGAALVAGAVLVAVGATDAASVSAASPGTEWSAVADAYARAPLLEGGGGALLGVGAAMIALGIVWLVVDDGERDVQVAAVPLVGGGAVDVEARW